MKNLMDRVELIANQLIAENNFSLRKLQDRFQGRKDDDSTIITVWDSYIQSKTNEARLALLVAVKMCATVLSKIWEWTYRLPI